MNFSWLKLIVASTASPVSARHNWFLPGGTQLIVIKNQLPSATDVELCEALLCGWEDPYIQPIEALA